MIILNSNSKKSGGIDNKHLTPPPEKTRFEIIKTESGYYDYFDKENQIFILETDYGVQGASRIDEEKNGILRYDIEGVPYIIKIESIKISTEDKKIISEDGEELDFTFRAEIDWDLIMEYKDKKETYKYDFE